MLLLMSLQTPVLKKELTREIIPPEPREAQEVVEQEPASPSTPVTPSVVEDCRYNHFTKF